MFATCTVARPSSAAVGLDTTCFRCFCQMHCRTKGLMAFGRPHMIYSQCILGPRDAPTREMMADVPLRWKLSADELRLVALPHSHRRLQVWPRKPEASRGFVRIKRLPSSHHHNGETQVGSLGSRVTRGYAPWGRTWLSWGPTLMRG